VAVVLLTATALTLSARTALADESVLAREPQVSPGDLGDGSLLGALQFGDPASNLALVDAPEAQGDGAARLSYPLVLPKGRGLTPELSLDYDSSGDDSWAGLDWDLSVGDISVDTRWGAPRFNPDKETESYDIDGALLTPNALTPTATGAPFEPREHGDRQDYTRQVETDFQQIIRRETGDGGPKNYYWEVHDKGGNVYWYGATSDDGGPTGDPSAVKIDSSAIVTDDEDNQVSWLLRAQRDVGVNQMDYEYRTINYEQGASGWQRVDACTDPTTVVCARHTYLWHIYYTSGASRAGQGADPAYRVTFLLQGDTDPDSDLRPDTDLRPDPIVDASEGFVDVTAERLARIKVEHAADPSTAVPGLRANYDELAMRYDLDYTKGPFGKSLLTSVSQVGTDGKTKATHTFGYHDNVTSGTATNGLGASTDWQSGDDLYDRIWLSQSGATGALGTSETNSAEGHAYIGFNPLVADKVGSFGGTVQVGGGATEAESEWLDLNGDGLPDKVFRDPGSVGHDLNDTDRDGPILYRLNHGDGTFTTGTAPKAQGITKLSRDNQFSFEVGAAAYPGASIEFALGSEVSWGDAYFTDVNADGLPDYVSNGTVYFNHLVKRNNPTGTVEDWIPTFTAGDSSQTPVPIDSGSTTVQLPPSVQTQLDKAFDNNPRIDTVRRWVAPFPGTVTISAPVHTLPLPDGTPADEAARYDGVRVAIQQDGDQRAAVNLKDPATVAFGESITRDVTAGTRLYFRVGSVDDGSNDRVAWNPTIEYTSVDGHPASSVGTDVNALSQTSYSAGTDFTLSGRPGTEVQMPLKGTVHFSATVAKQLTSDDVRLVLLHNGTPVTLQNATFAQDFQGTRTISADIDVAAPTYPSTTNQNAKPTKDTLSVRMDTDSPIDLHALTWNPTLTYTSAVDQDKKPVDLQKGPVTFAMSPEVQTYPTQSPKLPTVAWSPSDDLTRDLRVKFGYSWPGGDDPFQGVVTVKSATGVVARRTITLTKLGALTGFDQTLDLGVSLKKGTDYWFDVSFADPSLDGKVTMQLAELVADGKSAIGVPVRAHMASAGSTFPIPYRGWGVAGYNSGATVDDDRATKGMDESDFVLDTSNLPDDISTPKGFNDPDYHPVKQSKSQVYIPQLKKLTGAVTGTIHDTTEPIATWSGNRDNLSATGSEMSTSRLGSDAAYAAASGGSGGGQGVTRVGITGPTAALAAGIGPLAVSAAFAPSFGLVDYQDLNGDGYPDVVTPGHVTYTLPRGGFETSSRSVGEMDVSNQDMTFALGGGLESGLVDVKSNSKGKTNSTTGGSANKGGDAENAGGGVGFGIDYSWTNPNASTIDANEHGADLKKAQAGSQSGARLQQTLADVNGDGLPDRVWTTAEGVFAKYNLGYKFADAPVSLSAGGFESQESASGGLSFGFSTPWADFSGGAAVNYDVDFSRYSYLDVNGDGILDQVHKASTTDPDSRPTVRFGTGSGMGPDVLYGTMATTTVEGSQTGQQVSFDRSNGIGVQFDFTVPIGPLCLPTPFCFIIINPGASYQNSVSTTEVDLADVDGDGYADSVQSLDDNVISVRRNLQGDTDLLASVHTPLGADISLDYARYGNTIDSPDSTWALSKVAVDDGHAGDGVDKTTTTYTYDGPRSDKVQRTGLGFSKVVETEQAPNGDPLRRTTRTFMNDNVFDSGLQTSVRVTDPDGGYLSGEQQTWELAPIRPANPVSSEKLTKVAALGYSLSPELTKDVSQVGDGDQGVGEQTTTTYAYDSLGDVTSQVDLGEDDDQNDDVAYSYVYTRCTDANGKPYASGLPKPVDDVGHVSWPCAGDVGHDRPSPFFDTQMCSTWVSIPAEVTVTNNKAGAGLVVYRHRDGHRDLCDNASVTHLEETIGDGATPAETDLFYDAWGSYDRIVYPVGENGKRYAVQYKWDPDGHANIAQTTEYDLSPDAVEDFLGDGLTAGDEYIKGVTSSATFDPLSGYVASRTDANTNKTTYSYDPLGRIASVTDALSAPHPLVTYTYGLADGRSVAVAHHYDSTHPSDTIDTAVFVDGLDRTVQSQRDAAVFDTAGAPAKVGKIISGHTEYDALGRAVTQYRPVWRSGGVGTIADDLDLGSDGKVTTLHTDTDYDLWDEPVQVTEPGNRVTTLDYEYAQVAAAGPTVFQTSSTVPGGRTTVSYTDIRGVTRAVDDVPAGAPNRLTVYNSDGMGQLLQVTDPTGLKTTHTYDMLGRTTSTTTPESGRVGFGYDADGQLVSRTTPNLPASSPPIAYSYDLHRLTGIDYPGTKDDVSYLYGGTGAAGNGAGQIVREEDGARITTNAYDADGNLASQTAEMKLHNWYNATTPAERAKFDWTTKWTYDGLHRLMDMTYPDQQTLTYTPSENGGVGTGQDPGEKLTYAYDAGGLLTGIVGDEKGVTTETRTASDGTTYSVRVPHTWHYSYLQSQQYDTTGAMRYRQLGNAVTSQYDYDPATRQLSRQLTMSPNRDVKGRTAAYKKIQDLNYTYDAAGNPLTYVDDLPAATPSLFGGKTQESYSYDPYERLDHASGQWNSTGGVRSYSLQLGYDSFGNVVSKSQTDLLGSKIQDKTTYSFTRSYSAQVPRRAVAESRPDPKGRKGATVSYPYRYDADGNLTTILDPAGKTLRNVEWNALDRMTKITDGPDSTEFAYDDSGQRTIERGPQSEYATVNPWVTIKSGNIMSKNIWAGDDRIATKYDEPGGSEEQKLYFLHKDLQGSTNVVTDRLGQVFQHHEYFATGETWVDESSTVFRTPYQYGGGYADEVRDTINFGARWYDQGREMFYSPDPVLVEDPTAIVDKPELRTAYAYAGSNPVTNVDPTGYDYTDAIRKAYAADPVSFTHVLIANPALRASSMEALGDRMPKSVKYLVSNHERLTKRQELFEKIDGFNDMITPLRIEIGEDGKISKIKLFNFKSIYKSDSAAAASSPTSSTASSPTGTTDSPADLGSGPVASASSTGSSASGTGSSTPSATTDTPSSFTAANKPSSSSGGAGGELATHRRSSATTRAPTVAGSE